MMLSKQKIDNKILSHAFYVILKGTEHKYG
jgi:hypothetical protein